MNEEDFTFFSDRLKLKSYRKGQYFVKEGRVSKEIGFVGKGVFRTFDVKDGKEVNTEFYFENDFVSSYQSFLLQEPSNYYILAMEDAELLSFQYKDLQHAYDKFHSWEKFGRKVTECCYLKSISRTESFLFLSGEERYLQLLEKTPKLLDRIPLYHIASYLGIERESLSRLRRKIIAS